VSAAKNDSIPTMSTDESINNVDENRQQQQQQRKKIKIEIRSSRVFLHKQSESLLVKCITLAEIVEKKRKEKMQLKKKIAVPFFFSWLVFSVSLSIENGEN
jgi:hypothetical protein